jgi:uncharacterized membrane protein
MSDRDGAGADGRDADEANMEDVIDELEDLEEMVEEEEKREKVRETMAAAEEARDPGLVGRFHRGFGLRDAGEAVIGGFVFGVPLIVEDGTYEVGRFIARQPAYLAFTALFGLAMILGILFAGDFEDVNEDRVLGVVPLRLVGILAISGALAIGLPTIWGQIEWDQPMVAAGQATVIAIAMGVGASVGDILPE